MNISPLELAFEFAGKAHKQIKEKNTQLATFYMVRAIFHILVAIWYDMNEGKK